MTTENSSSDGTTAKSSNTSSQVYYEEVLTTAAALALDKNNRSHSIGGSNKKKNYEMGVDSSSVRNSFRYDNSNGNGSRISTSNSTHCRNQNVANGHHDVGKNHHSNFSHPDSNFHNSNNNIINMDILHNNNPSSSNTTTTTFYQTAIHNNNNNSTSSTQSKSSKQKIIFMSEEDAAILSSLPKQPIANFPNECDRKRIIGCLAAILSMMYHHERDFIDYNMKDATLVVNNDNEGDDNNVDDNNSDDDDDNGKKGFKETSGLVLNQSSPERMNKTNNSSTFDEDLIELEESFESYNFHNKNRSIDGGGNGSFVNNTVTTATTTSNSNKNIDSSIQNQQQQQQQQRWGKGKRKNIPKTQSHYRINNRNIMNPTINNNSNNGNNNSNNNSTSTTSNTTSNSTSPSKRRDKSSIIEQTRYRTRRHEIYSSFLVFAAELLFLDKSHAVAFLPLLNSLLGDDENDTYADGQAITFNGVEVGGSGNVVSGQTLMNHNNNTSTVKMTTIKMKESIREEQLCSNDNGDDRNHQQADQTWDNNDLLLPFVESLSSPGAGFQCLSLLLMNYLLRSQVGYDARIRHILKKLGVVLISHEMKKSGEYNKKTDDELAKLATRKFEALEDDVALKLLTLSTVQEEGKAAAKASNAARIGQYGKGGEQLDDRTKRKKTMENIVRFAKVGSVGIAAGTLFAVSGGLAAPGIAAGLAASGFTATAAAASIVTTLTSTAAVTTIFGVGGGSLAAYKTHRRIKGLTEFVFNKELKRNSKGIEGNLFSTICISGWLTDIRDFQRPWGVEPTNPPISDYTEKLTRFYEIYKPENISRIGEILKKWKGEEKHLWLVLQQKYGRDPDNLYPLLNIERRKGLTFGEKEIISNLMKELGYVLLEEEAARSNSGFGMFKKKSKDTKLQNDRSSYPLLDLDIRPPNGNVRHYSPEGAHFPFDRQEGELKLNRNTNIWDFQGEYGGELLTVRWESDLLVELCDSVTDMAVDLVGQAAKEILKQTALSTLITAIAWPYGLVKAANMIDGTWTLAIERADLAGVELARSLLESEAGHRPVVLVGFSMGARTVYSCLKELSRHQHLWEEQRMAKKMEKKAKKRSNRRTKTQSEDTTTIKYTREPASIVEDAVMMGLPNHLSLQSWESCRTVVAGRLVNCYSGKDLILSLMFQIKRMTAAFRSVCGNVPVNVQGVENFDVSNFIAAHSDYCRMAGQILRVINHGCAYRSNATIIVPNTTEVD